MLALSGGRDSVTLLDLLRPLCAARGIALSAAHVHHGLSAHADDWAAFCEALCRRAGVALHTLRVSVERADSTSVEAAARHARYRALAALAGEAGADTVVLAQHADDQAETLLLQLMRGAGPHGLAAMAPQRSAHAIAWLRPLLDVPRSAIDAHVAAHAIEHVDDDSNASMRFRRNALRQHVVPLLRTIAPGYPHTLVRAAALAGEAAALADELAELDAGGACDGATLSRTRLAALAPHRARNLLRWFLRGQGLRMPSSARLAQMLAQLARAAPDARVALVHERVVIGVQGDRVIVHAPPPPPFECTWHGERALALPHGTLGFDPQAGAGLRTAAPDARVWTVRARRGGEYLTLDASRPRRPLKALLHDASMPVWERDALPLVFCGNALAAVPGVGVDVAFRTDTDGVCVRWRPNAPDAAQKTR